MEIKRVCKRGFLFTYYDLGIPTNIYVIVGNDRYFIIDSYLGLEPMKEVDEFLQREFGEKDRIIINTHSDWDHIWGNAYFKKDIIISHSLCREDILLNGNYYLNKYKNFKRGVDKLKLPNLTFEDRLIFTEEAIEIFYSPGHSPDSISIYDRKDKVLYVGDNVERPIPHIQSKDIKTYIETLKKYLEFDIDSLLGGHTLIENKELVLENIDYLEDLLYKRKIENIDEEFLKIYKENLEFLEREE